MATDTKKPAAPSTPGQMTPADAARLRSEAVAARTEYRRRLAPMLSVSEDKQRTRAR